MTSISQQTKKVCLTLCPLTDGLTESDFSCQPHNGTPHWLLAQLLTIRITASNIITRDAYCSPHLVPWRYNAPYKACKLQAWSTSWTDFHFKKPYPHHYNMHWPQAQTLTHLYTGSSTHHFLIAYNYESLHSGPFGICPNLSPKHYTLFNTAITMESQSEIWRITRTP